MEKINWDGLLSLLDSIKEIDIPQMRRGYQTEAATVEEVLEKLAKAADILSGEGWLSHHASANRFLKLLIAEQQEELAHQRSLEEAREFGGVFSNAPRIGYRRRKE
jgi:hypothetical protein